jgi:hypothetical protein
MMNATPIIKSFSPPPMNRREIYRYMKCGAVNREIEALADKAILLCEGALRYDTVSLEMPIVSCADGVVDLGMLKIESRDLVKNLSGCDSVVVFAATVGIEIDRLIAKHTKLSPALALALQGYGAERIEALCDAFCANIKQMYGNARPRFSAGYGDLALEFQRDIFSLLSCHKTIGLTLNDSLLMSPTKSVTALVGIKKTDHKNEIT